jgi:chorismate mutase
MTELNHDLPDTDSYNPAASSLAGHVDPAVMAELLSIRSSIDNIDATLVYLLAERFKATQKVGFLKAAHRLPAGDPGRETAQIARLRRLAEDASWTRRLRKSS